jgi:hypothetical protein
VLVFAVSLYTAQSDPAQPKKDAEQKWSKVSHTYHTLNKISYYKVYNEARNGPTLVKLVPVMVLTC